MNDESNFFSFFFFLYYFCLVFFSRIDTLIFYSTLFSANIPLVVLPGMKNIGEKKFFLLLLAFLILLGFFTIPQKQCACTARKDLFLYFLQFFCSLSLFLSLSVSLCLSTFARHSHHYHCWHYFQPRQYVTITYLRTRNDKCKNIFQRYLLLLVFPKERKKELRIVDKGYI